MISLAWVLRNLGAWHERDLLRRFGRFHSPVSVRDTGAAFFRNEEDAVRMRRIVAERLAHEDMTTMQHWTRVAA